MAQLHHHHFVLNCDKPALHPWQLIDYRGVLPFDRLPDEFFQPWDPPSQVFICLYPSEHFSGGLPWEHANSVLHCWLSPFPFFCDINTLWWVQLFCSVFPEMTNQPLADNGPESLTMKIFGRSDILPIGLADVFLFHDEEESDSSSQAICCLWSLLSPSCNCLVLHMAERPVYNKMVGRNTEDMGRRETEIMRLVIQLSKCRIKQLKKSGGRGTSWFTLLFDALLRGLCSYDWLGWVFGSDAME